MLRLALVLGITLVGVGCASTHQPLATADAAPYDPTTDSLRYPGEVHLRNVRQLTFGGNNAEAYWSFDGDHLIFQSDWARINGQGCDQIFVMNVNDTFVAGDTTRYQPVSTMQGRTTCSYFLPDGRILYASTHAADPSCPPPARMAGGRYVWAIYDTYDIYTANADGSDLELLIGGEGYDAEATVSPDGKYIVFTSTRSGDLELWSYEIATGDLLQLTSDLGYDGGAFFSPDSKHLVWRASRPVGEEATTYRDLLGQGLVQPSEMHLMVANADGSNARQITSLGGAQWAPFFHPSGERILFASNHASEGGRAFALYMINADGDPASLQQITFSGIFDAFPMFSPDGTQIAFSSNRNTSRTTSRETNVFVADWVENPTAVDTAFESVVPMPASGGGH